MVSVEREIQTAVNGALELHIKTVIQDNIFCYVSEDGASITLLRCNGNMAILSSICSI